jgi:hypothetical protein
MVLLLDNNMVEQYAFLMVCVLLLDGGWWMDLHFLPM